MPFRTRRLDASSYLCHVSAAATLADTAERVRDAAQGTQDKSCPRTNDDGTGSDGDQSCQCAVDYGVEVVRLAIEARKEARAENARGATEGGHEGAATRDVGNLEG